MGGLCPNPGDGGWPDVQPYQALGPGAAPCALGGLAGPTAQEGRGHRLRCAPHAAPLVHTAVSSRGPGALGWASWGPWDKVP